MDEQAKKEIVRNSYNAIAERYLEVRDQYKNERFLDKLLGRMSQPTEILDLGCGSGVPISRYLIEHGHKVIGLDISERQIELARKQVPPGRFIVRDMTTLKEGDFAVGAIVSFYAIFHTPRETHENLLKTLRTFLPKGGLLLTTMGNSEWEEVAEDYLGVPMFWSHYALPENRKLIEKAGFEILEEEIEITNNEYHPIFLARAI
jgi:cyclopropane fatty-acyl-phospholipid synthase-like methyltransferase